MVPVSREMRNVLVVVWGQAWWWPRNPAPLPSTPSSLHDPAQTCQLDERRLVPLAESYNIFTLRLNTSINSSPGEWGEERWIVLRREMLSVLSFPCSFDKHETKSCYVSLIFASRTTPGRGNSRYFAEINFLNPRLIFTKTWEGFPEQRTDQPFLIKLFLYRENQNSVSSNSGLDIRTRLL